MRKFIFILLAVASAGLFAENVGFYQENSGKIITKINLLGLKKTKKSVVRDILEVSEGEKLSGFNEEVFSQDILKTGILQKPKIEYSLDGDKVVLDIHLKDKWTIIPGPIVLIGPDDQTYGALLYESNFLGLNKSLYVEGAYSTKNGIAAAINYMEQSIIPGLLSGNIGGGVSTNKDIKYFDFKGNDRGEYSIFNVNSFAGLKYRVNKFNSIGLTAKYLYYDIDNKSTKEFEGVDINQFFEGSLYYAADYQTYTSTICTGFTGTTSVLFGAEFEESDFYMDLSAEAKYTHRFGNNLHLRVGGSLSLLNKPFLRESYWGNVDYSKTVISRSHDRHAAGGVEVEYPILNFSWASFTLLALFEGGVYNRNDSNWVGYYGPGAGIRMYFPWMSVPAMGFDYGFNMEDSSHNFSLVMGM